MRKHLLVASWRLKESASGLLIVQIEGGSGGGEACAGTASLRRMRDDDEKKAS